ncbi:hypothetical protein ABE67_02450 [Cytobacillus firmus]|nr:hypothetical protein [Cytobacillus firmus]
MGSGTSIFSKGSAAALIFIQNPAKSFRNHRKAFNHGIFFHFDHQVTLAVKMDLFYISEILRADGYVGCLVLILIDFELYLGRTMLALVPDPSCINTLMNEGAGPFV